MFLGYPKNDNICTYMYFLFPKIFCFIFIEWYHDMKLMYLCNLNLKSIKEYDRRKLFIPLWVHWKAHLTKTIFNVLSTFYSIEFSIYYSSANMSIKLAYSEVPPNRRAWSLNFFLHFPCLQFFRVINQKFHPARLLIYLVNKRAGWHFF